MEHLAVRLKIIALGVVLALAAPVAAEPAANPYRWQNVTVGGGGFAPNIIFSPVEKGLAYLRTDMGGTYRWDVGAARWIPLQDDTDEGSYWGIESLAADPVDSNLVYLAAGMSRWQNAAFARSTDRGATWRYFPVPFKMGGNEDGRGLGERLAVNPASPATLLFGSRHDGLWRSDDRAAHWQQVARFPVKGLATPSDGQPTHAGIAFVVFDPTSRAQGRTVYAGVAHPGAQHLFKSTDGGQSWMAVSGGPPGTLLPVRAMVASDSRLYITYASSTGPNNIADGAVWVLHDGNWTDITPDKRADRPAGGYMGVAVAPGQPDSIMVTTINRWRPGDTLWQSTDGGKTWTDIGATSRRDTRATPFLNWGAAEAPFGHWTAGLAIDPFDAGHVVYTTGDTVYVSQGSDYRLWKPWVAGIEQTAIIALASPTGGAHLVSGFGDISGFVHDDFARSPTSQHLNPRAATTNTIDYAGKAPNILVRSGNVHQGQATDASLGLSIDGGHSWTPVRVPPLRAGAGAPARRFDLDGNAAIVVSADGGTLAVATPVALFSSDRGANWTRAAGLPAYARPVADKADPARFYAIDLATRRFLVSTDAGRSFAQVAAKGLPSDWSAADVRNRETPWPLFVSPLAAGDLWLQIGGALYHSPDGGVTFAPCCRSILIDRFAIGAAAPDHVTPTLFAWGTIDGLKALWRSDDGGVKWRRINDDAHRWGGRVRVIQGDPRLFGRVYVGTDGRGIIYGDPATP